MPDRPRSFREVVDAQTAAEQERLATAEAFKDWTAANPPSLVAADLLPGPHAPPARAMSPDQGTVTTATLYSPPAASGAPLRSGVRATGGRGPRGPYA